MMDLLFLSVEFPVWWVLLAIAGLVSCAVQSIAELRRLLRGTRDGH
ncbi:MULTISPECIES: hypothetical protein [Phaeobacter]|nr:MULTISPECIES: hypothetical protein [Phaeobacter]AUQ89376.1 hypothetical protein PhaeoP24_00730 [Phaeobacter inhibens]